MPLAKKHSLPIIGLAMDESGIPRDAASRVDIAGKILAAADKEGVARGDVFIDPLVMPISTDNTQGAVTLETLAGLKQQYPDAKSVLAVSNASFGLPKRAVVNSTLVAMAAYLGIDALLMNPMNKRLKGTVLASSVVLGRDRHCRKYSRAVRNEQI
jgi:5-methyltetrahydrofolate corrinoid/iron sulfur protein methyltransferase